MNPLEGLGPVEWSEVQDHAALFTNTLRQAAAVCDSVPGRHRDGISRSRANTLPSQSPRADRFEEARAWMGADWKEVKATPKEGAISATVYRMAGSDGRGAWFARRSEHTGTSIEDWISGFKGEFNAGEKVRGIVVEDVIHSPQVSHGEMNLYRQTAQFPGPTSPRDFITLNLSKLEGSDLKQFVMVSRPVRHDSYPVQQGYIRGQFESVEMVREIRRRRDSIGSPRASSADNNPPTIEWVMVTRSDPGGSVPRFMVERGTPSAILEDAGKFMTWMEARPKVEPALSVHSDPGAHSDDGEFATPAPPTPRDSVDGTLSSSSLSSTPSLMSYHTAVEPIPTTPPAEDAPIPNALGLNNKKLERHFARLKRQEEKQERKKRQLEAKQQRKNKKTDDVEALRNQLEEILKERDLARQETRLLRAQVGELQAVNTRLVAGMGRLGIEAREIL